MVGSLGMATSPTLPVSASLARDFLKDSVARETVERELDEATTPNRSVLNQHLSPLKDVAQSLLKCSRIDRTEVVGIVAASRTRP